MEELLEQELLLDQSANTADVRKEALSTARKLNQAVGRAVPVIKKGFVELVRVLRVTCRPLTGELRL